MYIRTYVLSKRFSCASETNQIHLENNSWENSQYLHVYVCTIYNIDGSQVGVAHPLVNHR